MTCRKDLPIIQTYDRYTEAFPVEANAVEVVVEADDVRSGETAAAIDELVTEAEASKTLLDGAEVEVSDDGTVASVAIPTKGNGTDDDVDGGTGRGPRRAGPGDGRRGRRARR